MTGDYPRIHVHNWTPWLIDWRLCSCGALEIRDNRKLTWGGWR